MELLDLDTFGPVQELLYDPVLHITIECLIATMDIISCTQISATQDMVECTEVLVTSLLGKLDEPEARRASLLAQVDPRKSISFLDFIWQRKLPHTCQRKLPHT